MFDNESYFSELDTELKKNINFIKWFKEFKEHIVSKQTNKQMSNEIKEK